MGRLRANSVVVMRGVPGSGKSTTANFIKNELKTKGLSCTICSADEFFIDCFGNYKFKGDLIGCAHEECFNRFKLALNINTNVIIVDNTSIQSWNYEKYNAPGYTVHVIEMEMEVGQVQLCQRRCVHEVSYEKILQMFNEFQHDGHAFRLPIAQ